MARPKVKLSMKGIREMKASIPDAFLEGLGERVASRAETIGKPFAHDGNYPVLVQVVKRPIAGKVCIVSCPLPWAMAIESKHGVMARSLGYSSDRAIAGRAKAKETRAAKKRAKEEEEGD